MISLNSDSVQKKHEESTSAGKIHPQLQILSARTKDKPAPWAFTLELSDGLTHPNHKGWTSGNSLSWGVNIHRNPGTKPLPLGFGWFIVYDVYEFPRTHQLITQQRRGRQNPAHAALRKTSGAAFKVTVKHGRSIWATDFPRSVQKARNDVAASQYLPLWCISLLTGRDQANDAFFHPPKSSTSSC